jgi:hypothetical protein
MDDFSGDSWSAGEPDYAAAPSDAALPPMSALAAASMMAPQAPSAAAPPMLPANANGTGLRRQDMPPDQRYAPPAHVPPALRGMGADVPPGLMEPLTPAPAPVQDGGGHMLGFALLAVGLGTVVGIKYGGGLYGGAAGGLAGGSLVNGVRAARMAVRGDPHSDREAIVSGTYTVLGFGLAGYLLYKARQQPSHKAA